MTPEFAERIDPVFRDVFGLLRRIEAGYSIDHAAARELLSEKLSAIIDEGEFNAFQWRLAVYAITCWIDEMFMVGQEWDGASSWRQDPLERNPKLYGTQKANDHFYVESAEAFSEDALESYHVCALLGFRGLYGTRDEVNEQRRRELQLPHTQSEWLDKMRDRIKRSRDEGKRMRVIETRSINVATPLRPWSTAIIPWVFVPILLGLVVVFAKL